MAAQTIEQRLHLVRQLCDIRKTEGCRTAFDGVRTTEDAIELFIIGLAQVQVQQHLLHLVEVFTSFFKEDLIELGQVEVRFRSALMCIRHVGSYLVISIR